MNPHKTISAMYDYLYSACDNKSWTNPVKEMFKMNLQEEKQYRNTRTPDNKKFTSNLAAKYFTVKHILEGLTSDLSVNDILHVRLSCYYGQAVANEYRSYIDAALKFAPSVVTDFESLDYAQLMKG